MKHPLAAALGALLIVLMPYQVAANEEARALIWKGLASYQIDKKGSPSHWRDLEQLYLASKFPVGIGAPPPTQKKIVEYSFNKMFSPGENIEINVRRKIDLIKATPAPGAELLGVLLQNSFDDYVHSPNYLRIQDKKNKPISPARKDEIVSGLFEKAEADENFRETFNDLFATYLGAPTNATIDEMLAANQDFAETPVIKAIAQNPSDVKSTLRALKPDVDNQILRATERTRKSTENQTSSGAASSPFAELANRLLEQQAEQRRLEDVRVTNQGLRSSAFLISKVLHPDDATRFLTVSNAVLDAREAIDGFRAYSMREGTSDFANAMSSAALTGNLVAVGLGLADAFSKKGPSPDQVMLEQMKQLAEMIAEFRKEVHARFDEVDRKLNVILDVLGDGINFG